MTDEKQNPWTEFKSGGSGDRPPIWKPEAAGDSISGTITEIWVFTKGDRRTPVLNLTTPDGPGSIWASQVQLRQSLAEQEPSVGDGVAVMFLGTKTLENGNTLNEYDVVVSYAAEPVGVMAEGEPPVEDEGPF